MKFVHRSYATRFPPTGNSHPMNFSIYPNLSVWVTHRILWNKFSRKTISVNGSFPTVMSKTSRKLEIIVKNYKPVNKLSAWIDRRIPIKTINGMLLPNEFPFSIFLDAFLLSYFVFSFIQIPVKDVVHIIFLNFCIKSLIVFLLIRRKRWTGLYFSMWWRIHINQ